MSNNFKLRELSKISNFDSFLVNRKELTDRLYAMVKLNSQLFTIAETNYLLPLYQNKPFFSIQK